MDHWEQLAELPLVVESLAHGRIDPGPGFGEAHSSRLVRLAGAGHEGRGEDITLFMGGTPPMPDVAGRWTLGELCAHLDGAGQWPDGPPAWDLPPSVSPEGAKAFAEMAYRWRNWAFESAALDLALAQAGRPLHEVIGREPRPVTYVNSLGLGDPASADTVLRRLERYPRLRFKLDAAVTWTPEIVDALVATGAVHTIDFKGHYGMEVDRDALPGLYERLLAAFPDALIEDPHDLPEIAALVEPHAARVSYDAPIHTVADLDAVPHPRQDLQRQAEPRRPPPRPVRALRRVRVARVPPVRRRHGRARRRPRADPAPRGHVLARRAERHRTARLQRARPRAGAAREPAGPGPRAPPASAAGRTPSRPPERSRGGRR